MAALPSITFAAQVSDDLRYFLGVNGIRTEARNTVSDWPMRMEDWIESHGFGSAGYYGYHVDFWDRWLWQKKHVANVMTRVTRRRLAQPELKVIGVGHSNGCAIWIDALRSDETFGVAELHLVAAAAEPSFEKNGLNSAIRRGQVKRVVCYCSAGDEVLAKVATWSKRLLGGIGLGYGNLGWRGPIDVDPEFVQRGIVSVEWRDARNGFADYGHSDYFAEGANFERQMKDLTEHFEELASFNHLDQGDFDREAGK